MKTYVLALLFLLFTLCVVAQPNRDQIRTLKVAFITEKLDLSPIEAQGFWPVYNAYEESMAKIKFKELRSIRRNIKKNVETLNDSESKNLLDRLIVAEDQLHDAKVNLIMQLKKVISPQKILLLKVAEDEFNKKLFEQLRQKRKEQKPQ